MRKVSGFALFAIKRHRVCSFSKNGTEASIRQKAGIIPEYPAAFALKVFIPASRFVVVLVQELLVQDAKLLDALLRIT